MFDALTTERPVVEGVLLGIDYGLKRTGLSVCDREGRVAVGAGWLEGLNGRKLTESISAAAQQRGAVGCVIGQPAATRGNEDLMKQVDSLATSLEATGLNVVRQPESFTTASALAARKYYGGKKSAGKGWTDEAAAVLILQDYLDWKQGRAAREQNTHQGGFGAGL